jgi:hypothetical protein
MPVFTIEHKSLAIVPSFKYLGSILWEDCSIDLKIQNRIKHQLPSGKLKRRVFLNWDRHLHTKVAIYQAILHHHISGSLIVATTSSFNRFHIRWLQCILGITWCNYVPHTEILAKTSCKSMEAMVTQHQLHRLGHVITMSQERLPWILYGQIHLDWRSVGLPHQHRLIHTTRPAPTNTD